MDVKLNWMVLNGVELICRAWDLNANFLTRFFCAFNICLWISKPDFLNWSSNFLQILFHLGDVSIIFILFFVVYRGLPNTRGCKLIHAILKNTKHAISVIINIWQGLSLLLHSSETKSLKAGNQDWNNP